MGALGWLLNLDFAGSDPGGPAFLPVWLQTINQQGDMPMLLKNTASQVVGAQIIDTNGDAQTTGTTTVYVTGDGGTQASGGTATHEGNGYWSFLPSQANTNYTQAAFTFVNDDADAIPVTKEYYCVSFDYTDAVRIGITALPNAAADASGGLPISDAGGLDMDAILADTNELQGDWTNGGRLDNILDARASQTSVDTVDSNVDTILVDTADMQPKLGTPAADISADIAAVKVDTGNIETDTQNIQSRLPAALVTGRMSSDAVAISGSTDAADKLEASAETIVVGTAQTGTLSTTQMSSDLTEATDDHYIGRIVIWTSGALKDQASDITDYTGTNGVLTYTAVTEAPSNGDTFVIV